MDLILNCKLFKFNCKYYILINEILLIIIRVVAFNKGMRQKFSAGNKCECMCHGKEGIIDYCGYCSSSHRRINTSYRSRN